jgi:hypothetical protein
MILRAMWSVGELFASSRAQPLELQVKQTRLYRFCNHPEVMVGPALLNAQPLYMSDARWRSVNRLCVYLPARA